MSNKIYFLRMPPRHANQGGKLVGGKVVGKIFQKYDE